MIRRCIVCDARVRNLNPKAKTCGPVCTQFYHEHKEAIDRGEKVPRFEDAVRRDIERAETSSAESDSEPIYYRRSPFRSLKR